MSKKGMAVEEAPASYSTLTTKHDVPPGYKKTEVGIIPADWSTKLLSECCSRITDGTHDTPKPVRAGIPFLTAVHVRDGFIDFDTCLYLPQEVHDSIFNRCNPEKDDVLMVNIGAGVATTALVKVNYEFSLKNVALLKPNRANLSGTFLQYCLATQKANLTQLLLNGGAQPFLSLKQIGTIRIPFPSVREQHAIATALSDVDALLEELDRLIAKKRSLKQAAMQQLLTGQTRLPGFEGEWEVKRLGDHVTFLRNGVNSRAELTAYNPVKYLHYGDIHAQSSSSMTPHGLPCLPTEKSKTLDRLKEGDLIFADASEDIEGVGKSVEIRDVGDIELVAGLHTIAVRFDKKILADGFKAYLQFSPKFIQHLRKLAAGTKVYATNKSHIASVRIPMPSAEEQVAIASILADMDTELQALEQRRAKTAALKQAAMQELLTGRTRLV